MWDLLSFAFIGLLAIIALFVVLPWREKEKMRKKALKQLGNVPEGRPGLRGARTFWQAYSAHVPSSHPIDDITWNDLEMDDVFGRINACQSNVGDAWLYASLRQPKVLAASIEKRQALQDIFVQNPALCIKVQLQLARLGRQYGGGLEIPVFSPSLLSTPNLWVYRLFAIAPFASLLLIPFSPTLGIVASLLFLFGNSGLFIGYKAKNETGFLAVREVAACMGAARRLAPMLRNDAPAFSTEMSETVRKFASFSRANALLEFNNKIEEVLFDPLAFFLLPLLSYIRLTGWLKKNPQTVLHLYELLGEADMAACFASVGQTFALTCRPIFTQSPEINFTNLCHPLLEEPVPNSAHFNRDVLLTGSNASGKSTFVKSIAINLLLAQTVGICIASEFVLKRGVIASSMAVADSTIDGDSYFIAEIKSMRRLLVLAECGEFCYFFIDEILKGTNTIERIAASAAVLQTLYHAHCLCFTATHDIELTDILSQLYSNYHFRETITQQGVLFDYKLHEGPSTTRNAILLLERMNFPVSVPKKATRLAADFEKFGTWEQLQK